MKKITALSIFNTLPEETLEYITSFNHHKAPMTFHALVIPILYMGQVEYWKEK